MPRKTSPGSERLQYIEMRTGRLKRQYGNMVSAFVRKAFFFFIIDIIISIIFFYSGSDQDVAFSGRKIATS